MLMIHPPRCLRTSVLLVLAVVALTTKLSAQAPLHQRIDQLIEAKSPDFQKVVADASSEDEFLRRIYLSLTGDIPTPTQARAFFADKDPNKRTNVIDQLLASPEHARHLSEVFNVMLLERRSGKNVADATWLEYLRTSFLANKPWDQLAREILSADGVDAKNLGPAKFFMVRNAEVNLVTKDIGRLFLGMNLECAQCHDSPVVDTYLQRDYYGISAFFNRTYLVKDKKLKRAVLGEKAEGEVTFSSVFDTKKIQHTTQPRAPGRPALKDPKIEKGKEYKVKPAKSVMSVPTYSRRALLGNEIARADSERFKRNIANRLWAMMMGRGLVNPVDLDHPDNPPSHPELLKLLAEEMASHKFDVRYLLREIALSKAYQRSSIPPSNVEEVDPELYAVGLLRPLAPEALARSIYEATGGIEIQRQTLERAKKLTEPALHAQVVRQVTPLIRAVSGQPGEEEQFEPTLDQALFVANNPLIGAWLKPAGNNLLGRLTKLKDDHAVAEELYLSVLTRMPSDDERKEVSDYLREASTNRVQALQEYAWALLASAEFRFNH